MAESILCSLRRPRIPKYGSSVSKSKLPPQVSLARFAKTLHRETVGNTLVSAFLNARSSRMMRNFDPGCRLQRVHQMWYSISELGGGIALRFSASFLPRILPRISVRIVAIAEGIAAADFDAAGLRMNRNPV